MLAALLAATAACLSPRLARAGAEERHPVYVGWRVCVSCHRGEGMGHQDRKWLLSGHARAYASLAKPESRRIARLSGVPEDPQKSPICLGCHATGAQAEDWEKDPGFALEDGVQCEKCHGPGSEYAAENVMRDRKAAEAAGLNLPTPGDCVGCHAAKGSHDAVYRRPPFDAKKAWEETRHPMPRPAKAAKPSDPQEPLPLIAPPTKLPREPEPPRYKTPLNLALSPDGRRLYVACEASHTLAVIDVPARRTIAEIPVGRQPTSVAFHPDGTRVYVSNRLDDSVSVVDVASGKVSATIPVGDEPHGVLTDRAGKLLYVLNASSDSISVVDTASLKETKRLEAGRSPWSLALSPDGATLCATNALSAFVKFRTPSVSEVTVIDTARAVVKARAAVPAANLVQGIAWHPSGKFALITLNRTKNLVPMTRLLQGWTITNGLGVVWRNGRVDQVLLDEPGLCFPDPADVAITPDGRLALVTSSGSDRVAVLDVRRLVAMIEEASDYDREHVLPNHLGKPTEFVIQHVPTRNSPRGIAIARDGKTAFVANALDDSVTVIDLATLAAVGRIGLGGPKEITKVRRGERLFHSAANTFHRQFSCHSCHPDGHVDGLTYDTEPDGIGCDPVDNRTLRGIVDTAPFKWTGKNPSLQRQCGARLAVFFTRIQPFTPEEVEAVEEYICTIPRPPNRYRPLGAELTPAQRRGKAIFERTRANGGRAIPKRDRCVTCHFPPLYTDRQLHDVGTKSWLDHESRFDVPHLTNVYDSAPYLHNGIAETLEEIWTRYNPEDKHGVTNDLTKDQLNDLIEYLKTL